MIPPSNNLESAIGVQTLPANGAAVAAVAGSENPKERTIREHEDFFA